MNALEREVMDCVSNRAEHFIPGSKNDGCHIFDPYNQPSVARELAKGWDPIVWWVHNGRSYNAGGGTIVQLSSCVIACRIHEDKLIADGGWDGTGDRQSDGAKN